MTGRDPPFLLIQDRGSWHVKSQKLRCLVARVGPSLLPYLVWGEIQRAVYIDRHFSGFNTKSSIANDSCRGFCLILCFNATPSLGFFKVSAGSGGATLGCK